MGIFSYERKGRENFLKSPMNHKKKTLRRRTGTIPANKHENQGILNLAAGLPQSSDLSGGQKKWKSVRKPGYGRVFFSLFSVVTRLPATISGAHAESE